jgi:hypothetical protein
MRSRARYRVAQSQHPDVALRIAMALHSALTAASPMPDGWSPL